MFIVGGRRQIQTNEYLHSHLQQLQPTNSCRCRSKNASKRLAFLVLVAPSIVLVLPYSRGCLRPIMSGRGFPRHPSSRARTFSLSRKVLVLGVVVGGLNACVAGLVPLHLPHLFTNSPEVTAGMRSLTPLLSWSLLTHACVMGLEGILLARRRLRFLAGWVTSLQLFGGRDTPE